MLTKYLIKCASQINCINKEIAQQSYEALLEYFTQPYLDRDDRETKRTINRITRIGGIYSHELLKIINQQQTRDDINERIHQAVLNSGMPEKEFYEAKEFYTKIKPVFFEYFRLKNDDQLDQVIDFCSGNGLNGIFWLLHQAAASVSFVDNKDNSNFNKLEYLLGPYISNSSFSESIPDVSKEKTAFTAIHACGELTDWLIDTAVKTRKPFGVMPCCHLNDNNVIKKSILNYFSAKDECIDIARIITIKQSNYRVLVRNISKTITDKNRIIVGVPDWEG